MRRGVPREHALWGVPVAVRTGDFLFARASGLVAQLGDDATHLHARTFSRLVEGQASETVGPQSEADTLNHYIRVLNGKTASLFAVSGRLGTIMAGASGDVAQSVENACEAWGLAYQLCDDVLDVTSDVAESGKPSGADLRLTDHNLHAEALELLRAHPSIDMARAEVRKWAGIAEHEISALPDSPARSVFVAMCDLVRQQVSK